MKLENLKPAKGATHNSKRLGRGQGSGKGGTSTRGTKGAQARAGYEHKIGFEGGSGGVAEFLQFALALIACEADVHFGRSAAFAQGEKVV